MRVAICSTSAPAGTKLTLYRRSSISGMTGLSGDPDSSAHLPRKNQEIRKIEETVIEILQNLPIEQSLAQCFASWEGRRISKW